MSIFLDMEVTIVGPTGPWSAAKLEFQAGYNRPQTYLVPVATPVTTIIVGVTSMLVLPIEPHLTKLEITKYDDTHIQIVCDSDVDYSFHAKAMIRVELDF